MKKNEKIIHSIDKTHSSFIEEFYKDEYEKLPKLKKKKDDLLKKSKSLKSNEVDKFMALKDSIKDINQEINEIKKKKKQYYLDNSKHLFTYFEERKKISEGETKNVNVLNNFFKQKDNDINHHRDMSKHSIIQYWKNVNGDVPYLQEYVLSSHNCLICNQGELVPLEEEGVLICNNVKCGQFLIHMIDNQKPLNKEMPNEVSYTAYIRLNHFKEILSQFQAKETTKIPEEVIDAVKNRIAKERKQLKDLNYAEMRNILSILGYNKYFEHIQYINSILGIKPPTMSEELHETLCVLFIEIQQPWAIFCPITRTNFFNYTYILCQLCVLLDQKQYLPYIPMMKDRIKQFEQDMIWKKVCEYLDWEYFPTV